ncbi:hypothetical protein NDU88_001431 [Pleurodeles waltl]|uniref:Uncharacterized protein n=1 Tax=Pleurodeles waltl TaxID=8319 RepID=A0AAV7Q4A4_PLEWA|nr:hypothetical protein NDU88_001431 [Pleurodeles waltl]
MMSPWDLVSPQARDSVDPGPFPGSRPSFLPFRCPLGCRLQDPQGPCLQSLPRSRSRSRGGAFRCFTFLGGGGAADDLLWRGSGPPRFVANDQQSQAPGYRPSRLPLIGVR